jgi:hypothetical protein
MKILNNFIEKNIKKILSIFFIAQPLLDVSAALMLNLLRIDLTLSSIIRFLFFIFCIYYLLFINKNKKNHIYVFSIILYFIFFSSIILLNKDFSALLYELKNTFNVFYFPIILLALFNIFKQYKINCSIKNIIYIYSIYVLLILIPNLTHTSFMSYSDSKVGSAGWFLSANSVGNILSILFPFALYYIITTKKKYVFRFFIIISSLYIFSSVGTKTPLLCLLICFCLTFVYYLILWFKNKKYKYIVLSSVVSFILVVCACFAIPKTSFYKNIEIHKNFLGINNYSEIFKDYRLLDHFIFSQRLTFLGNTCSFYNRVDIPQKLFGIGFIENYGTDFVSTKTIEMDYFDILFRNGIIGFCLFFSVFSIINERKKCSMSLVNYEMKISIILILILAFFTGHILISPQVSIFVSLIVMFYCQGGLYEENYKR